MHFGVGFVFVRWVILGYNLLVVEDDRGCMLVFLRDFVVGPYIFPTCDTHVICLFGLEYTLEWNNHDQLLLVWGDCIRSVYLLSNNRLCFSRITGTGVFFAGCHARSTQYVIGGIAFCAKQLSGF